MNRLILVVPLVLLVAACGTTSSPPPSPSAAVPSASSAAPSATDVATASPSASAVPSADASGASPSASGAANVPHADPELEARLPGEVNGAQLEKFSFGGSAFLNDPNLSSEAFRSLVQSLGAEPEDVTIAVAQAQQAADLQIAALRVAGADTAQMVDSFVQATLAAAPGSTSTEVDIGGRKVVRITTPDDPLGGQYIIGVGDAIYLVETADAATAAAALGLLPQS